ncbi:primosomal protein N' [Nocardioides sp. GY 10113]|nr:primosomal protein N' [Nocardioides sp. GY 10113]TIC82518.1 primosomal protein N' [Nocardioides sp. GY 10113]
MEITDVDPVAGVLLDLGLPHLDREFDYAVPVAMAEGARPGARVKVRFGGQDVDGFVVRRGPTSDHDGRLAPLRRLVSPEPVLSPAVRALCDRVAEHYAGASADVRRLAVPPRHATVEREPSPPEPPLHLPAEAARAWDAYPAAPAFLEHLRAGHAPRAVWSVAPGEDWPHLLAVAAAATLAGGRGTVLCLPDHRDVARVDAALRALLGEEHHVTLRAEPGPAARYRDFLAVARGTRRIVVGTRSAAFAPVRDLGLVVVWDDGDDLHAEPRAPYPHVREVLGMRAEIEGAGAIVAGFGRSVEGAQLLAGGWAREISLPRERRRDRVLVAVSGASEHALRRDPHAAGARIPKEAHDAVRWGLEHGPVLVQVPRAGYALRLACERCRTPARCAACTGPLQLTGPTTPPACRWCATVVPDWTCGTCGGHGLRAPVLGDARTADELGRIFPRVPVVTSSGDRIRDTVPAGPRIVVATPGAEPVAEGGYAVVVLLDTWLALAHDGLRTAEDAVRRWANAIGLVRAGGRALAVGDPGLPALQTLVRWDPEGFAVREAEERRSARLPPAARLATLTGTPGAIGDLLTLTALPAGAEVLGPLPAPPPSGGAGVGNAPGAGGDARSAPSVVERMLVRVPQADGPALARALREAQRARSARRLEPVRIQVDPPRL